MKRLPEDFKINILLPGSVWLLVSTFIGYAGVAQLETNAITFILFVVIMSVVFIVPMTVYMEYRRRIEKWFDKKEKQVKLATPVLPTDEYVSLNNSDIVAQMLTTDESIVSNLLPPDFPDALKGEKTINLLDALRREGFLNNEYRPCKGYNATQMAFIADSIATICNISYQWKTFGNYWQLPNLRQLLGAKDRRGSKMEKEDIIVDILKRVAETNKEIGCSNSFQSWLKGL